MVPSQTQKRSRDPEATRSALIEAAVQLILRQGFAATSVGQICEAAGVTKGSFFHHFDSKDRIGEAALAWWGDFGESLYAAAWQEASADPLDQLAALFAIMEGFSLREDLVCTCVVGMLSQETAQSNDTLREAAARELERWTANTARLLSLARDRHCPAADFDPDELAWHLNSLWQGSMLVAKARQDPALIRRNLSHARRWLSGFFPAAERGRLTPNKP